MPVIRCPQCNSPLTEEETLTGACPMCSAALELQATAAPAPRQAPVSTPPKLIYSLLWAIGGTLAFCFLPVGIIFYKSLPEDPPEKEIAQKKPDFEKKAHAEVKKPNPLEKKPSKQTADEKEPNDEEKKIKQEESKKPEPKKIDIVKKADVPKQPEPKWIPALNRQRLAMLPLLSETAIKIDGDLSDWKDIPPILLYAAERGQPTRKAVTVPNTQKAYLAYCPKGILIAVDIVDTSGVLEDQAKPANDTWVFWDNDAVEIYIDTLNLRPQRRGQANAHQFFAFPLGLKNDPGVPGYESQILKNNVGRNEWTIVPLPAAGANATQRAGKKTVVGWTMEILIPRSVLRLGDIKPGKTFGFELQIDTGTNMYYFWANDHPRVQVSTNPSLWGEVRFAGSDAVVELLGADKKSTATFKFGKPLTVRVTDADRNLDPTKKEKINVMLISRDDRKTVLLEETEPNSGAFVGSIATRLKGGRRVETVFEVVAGENIVMEYLDLVRSNGERNVMVRTNVTAKTP